MTFCSRASIRSTQSTLTKSFWHLYNRAMTFSPSSGVSAPNWTEIITSLAAFSKSRGALMEGNCTLMRLSFGAGMVLSIHSLKSMLSPSRTWISQFGSKPPPGPPRGSEPQWWYYCIHLSAYQSCLK